MMTLEDLISELRENILHDRSDRTEGDTDLMWTDATLVRYINEAQNRFARKTYVLRDGTTPEATRITLVEGQDEYPLHPSVMAVISAQIEGERRALARTGYSVLAGQIDSTQNTFDSTFASTIPPGRPLAYSTDETFSESDAGMIEATTLRVYPVPDMDSAGTVLRLRVIRAPLYPLSLRRLNARPEIPEIYHLDMLDWAAYLALRVVDLDAGLPNRAMEFRASFEQHVKEARQETLRKRFAPIVWGFGRDGYSWER